MKTFLFSSFSADSINKMLCLGRGGGQVVSVLAFYSDDLSSNPAEVYNFSNKIVIEKNENKQNEAGVGPFKKNMNMLRQS